jgi:class 3 adenylate cyclase
VDSLKKVINDSFFSNLFENRKNIGAFDSVISDRLVENRQIIKADGHVKGLENYTGINLPNAPQPEYQIQRPLRKYFDKPDYNYTTIAQHPDFHHLKDSDEIINQYICSMFIDIKGSTRLSLKYDLPFVYKFKNAVIQACIEVIRSFDGYVHRIMGDAVLGFFGSSEITKEQAILDCMNCAAMLKIVLEQNIQPWLREEKPDFEDVQDFGFRIGCNFGDDHEVLWANYGYGATGEVSPTGLPVDLAAKLQGLSSKNKSMMGQGILEFFNWPENFSQVKTREKNGETINIPHVTPNYVKDGYPLNYMMRELDQKNYLQGLPIPTDIKQNLCSGITHNNLITLKNKITSSDGEVYDFKSNSKVIPKNSSITTEVHIFNESILLFPLNIKFIKKNNLGFNNEPELLETINQKDEAEFTIYYSTGTRQQTNIHKKSINRDCMYRGIHQLICEVRNKDNKLIFRDIVNVPIE